MRIHQICAIFSIAAVAVISGCVGDVAPPPDSGDSGPVGTEAGPTAETGTPDAGPDACVPKTSADCGPNSCGSIPDGCGGTVACGTCGTDFTCAADADSGVQSCVCNNPKQDPCAGLNCGTVVNCGKSYNCGTCGPAQSCGYAAQGVCGGCVPVSNPTCGTGQWGAFSHGWDCSSGFVPSSTHCLFQSGASYCCDS